MANDAMLQVTEEFPLIGSSEFKLGFMNIIGGGVIPVMELTVSRVGIVTDIQFEISAENMRKMGVELLKAADIFEGK